MNKQKSGWRFEATGYLCPRSRPNIVLLLFFVCDDVAVVHNKKKQLLPPVQNCGLIFSVNFFFMGRGIRFFLFHGKDNKL